MVTLEKVGADHRVRTRRQHVERFIFALRRSDQIVYLVLLSDFRYSTMPVHVYAALGLIDGRSRRRVLGLTAHATFIVCILAVKIIEQPRLALIPILLPFHFYIC